MATSLVSRLGLIGPLIQAPMAGGPTTTAMVIEASNAGALGSLGAAYLTPEEIEKELRAIRAATSRPVAVNLFAPAPDPSYSAQQLEAALDATRAYRQSLGLADRELHPPYAPDFRAQFETVLRAKPEVLSFTFGLLEPGLIRECKARGILTAGTATSLDEGLALQKAGVDAVVAQGVEAGGHRGLFQGDQADPAVDPQIGTLELTHGLTSRLDIPVIASGGIMDGRGIADALSAGAQAAQLGTAFLLCKESGASAPYRAALVDPARKTRLTRAFSGRWARGLENRFLLEMASRPEAILPFPAQNEFTRDIRRQSVAKGSAEYLSLWAGDGVRRIREGLGVAELVGILLQETEQVLAGR